MKTRQNVLSKLFGLATMAILLFCCSTRPCRQPAGKKRRYLRQGNSCNMLGVDTCMTCHEELYKKSFENTPHFKTTLHNGHGCESCHGPGSEHVEGGGDVSKIISFKTITGRMPVPDA